MNPEKNATRDGNPERPEETTMNDHPSGIVPHALRHTPAAGALNGRVFQQRTLSDDDLEDLTRRLTDALVLLDAKSQGHA